MLTLRGIFFTILVPGMVGGYIPWLLHEGHSPARGAASLGWLPVVAGAAIYVLCLLRFLAAGGTPMIYFAHRLRLLLGEEPHALVEQGLYRWTRNPMYVGVLAATAGQAIVFQSWAVALYTTMLFLWLHFVVTTLEEPHLLHKMDGPYAEYCRRVPRWLGIRMFGRRNAGWP